MAMNCDILFAYALRREYLGAMNYRNVSALQVQRVFDATLSSHDFITGIPTLRTGAYTGVVVNGIEFGTGRIVSFNNPVSADITENGRHLWKQIVNFEIYSSGDFSNLGSDPSINGLLGVYHPQLVGLDETFSFDIPQDGGYQYSHGAMVKCIDSPTGGETGFVVASKIASGLIAASLPFGYIDAVHRGFIDTSIGRRLYTETTDTINGSVTFEEKFLIQDRDFIKHSVGFDNGFVNITENATLRNSGVSKVEEVFNRADVSHAMNRYDTLSAGAYTRCNSLWSTYRTVLGLDAYTNDLNLQPSQITRIFDERTQELTYTLIYTNNPKMTVSGYTVEREQNLSVNTLGITEATEQTSLMSYWTKDPSLRAALITAVNNESGGSLSRLVTYWNDVSNYKLAGASVSVSDRGKKATYNLTYTNDPSFVNDGTFLTKSVAIQDNGAVRMHAPYFIMGRTYPLIHNPGQTQMGNVSCTVTAALRRPIGYYPTNVVRPNALNLMFSDAINYVLKTISAYTPLDVFVSKVAYVYDSSMSTELTVEAQYGYAKQSNV